MGKVKAIKYNPLLEKFKISFSIYDVNGVRFVFPLVQQRESVGIIIKKRYECYKEKRVDKNKVLEDVKNVVDEILKDIADAKKKGNKLIVYDLNSYEDVKKIIVLVRILEFLGEQRTKKENFKLAKKRGGDNIYFTFEGVIEILENLKQMLEDYLNSE